MRTDLELRRLSKAIRLQQRRLRRELSESGWRVYLRLEELVNERLIVLVDRLLDDLRPRRRQAGRKAR